ncbi:phage protein [Bacillus thuringiensis MC28]|nr:phage protein [Bacillus thuringiensis MC28]
MEDTTSLVIFAMVIAGGSWLFYITYEPIKQWAWSDVKQNKKDPWQWVPLKKHLL